MAGAFIGQPGRQAITNQISIAIGKAGTPTRIYDCFVVSGGTAAAVKLYNGTAASGSDYIQIDGVISKSTNALISSQGMLFPLGCFASVDANTVNLVASYVNEL